MLFTKAALCISSLIFLAFAQEPADAVFKGLTSGHTRTPTSASKLMARSLDKRCSGSCAECFGSGYTLCPGSSISCYLPGDDFYGIDSCSTDSSDTGSSYTSTADASASTSTSSSGYDDICSQTGATCTSCFGSGYEECDDGYHCYNPDDPQYATCPDNSTDSSDSGSGSGGSSSNSCAATYGAGNIACGTDSCYNPDDGEVCCQDGYYCTAGHTCSSIVGKCCAPGSTSSSCSGSSGLLSSSTYDFSDYTTTSDFSLATSTSGFGGLVTTATTTVSGSSSTGNSVLSQDTSNAGVVAVGRGLLLAAGVGALVL
ncbi:hypothetical protein LTS15_000572 [Exophiala xenobiotica]|nr:hypothetical protein LTS15_000572 [Exophiala xenobiotica]